MATATIGHPAQSIGAAGAFARQFRLLWTSRRPVLLGMAVLGLLALLGPPVMNAPLPIARLVPGWALFLLAAPIWAFAVFHNEGPGSRYYHSSQPVGRTTHTLARVAAGLAWLLLASVLFVLAGLLFATVDGNTQQLATLPAAAWVNVVSGPVTVYLGISALTVVSDYPIRWFFGLNFLALVVAIAVHPLGLGLGRLLTQPLAHPDLGLGWALFGGFIRGVATIAGEHPPGDQGAAVVPGAWWVAMGLWLALSGAVTILLASIHPDRLPQLRGSR